MAFYDFAPTLAGLRSGRIGGAAPAPAPPANASLRAGRAPLFSGHGRIENIAAVEAFPGQLTFTGLQVRIYDATTGAFVAETTPSTADGAYRFDYLDPNRSYVLIARDLTQTRNAAIADFISRGPDGLAIQ
jgi:hypothetical protein